MKYEIYKRETCKDSYYTFSLSKIIFLIHVHEIQTRGLVVDANKK